MASASASSLAAPRAEFVEPWRSRVAAITGAASRGRHNREQRVDALDPGVAAPSALLGVAVGLAHGVVDIDEHQLIGAGEQRGHRRESGQQTGGHGIELADVAESEPAQERAQRRGCPHLVEHPVHAAVAQQINVGDRVRTRDHPADQGGDLCGGVRGALPGQGEPLDQQAGQPAASRQGHDRYQPDTRHEVGIVEPHADRSTGMG
jgi:hypothetical protein